MQDAGEIKDCVVEGPLSMDIALYKEAAEEKGALGRKVAGDANILAGQTIIDNISIEYRLDKSASRYVNIFYDNNYESLIEGQVTKMGGGIVLRKKADKLSELFIFKKTPQPLARPEEKRKEQEKENENETK